MRAGRTVVAAIPIELDASPGAVLGAWPPEWPLRALWSGDDSSDSRWTILARPSGVVGGTGAGATIVPGTVGRPVVLSDPDAPRFAGGWVGSLSFELGAVIEPRARCAQRPADRGTGWPMVEWRRCDDALVFDHALGRWWQIGDLDAGFMRPERGAAGATPPLPFSVGLLRSTTGRVRYVRAVERVVEYIRAGDVYQVNLAHELCAEFRGSSRSLFATIAAASRPWFGAYLESGESAQRRALLSFSPELFLEFDPGTRRVVTRPMKGTRPGAASPSELEMAPKDRAELAMIIDLMRNDLGRVCEFGSVRVENARAIERHGGSAAGAVLQATGRVCGTLRAGLTVDDLVRATFPGGSVTGAPKIRAMQIIDELEWAARGPYCGCVGYVSDSGHAMFSIAIRTALIDGCAGAGSVLDVMETGTLRYRVGAGIVADSDPGSEWRETLDKAGPMRAVTTVEDE